MIAAETFLSGRVLPFPAVRSRIPPSFTAFEPGSHDWNATVVVIDAGSRMVDGRLVIEIVSDGRMKHQRVSLKRARTMVRELDRAIEAAGPEAAQVCAGAVMFAVDEAEALRGVLRRAVRRCEIERRETGR